VHDSVKVQETTEQLVPRRWTTSIEIADKACELSEDAESEAAWNCFVHGHLCKLAESSSLHSWSVSIENMFVL